MKQVLGFIILTILFAASETRDCYDKQTDGHACRLQLNTDHYNGFCIEQTCYKSCLEIEKCNGQTGHDCYEVVGQLNLKTKGNQFLSCPSNGTRRLSGSSHTPVIKKVQYSEKLMARIRHLVL